MTRDGAVVVAHDPFVSAAICTGPDGRPIEGERGPRLRDLSLAELRRYDCGSRVSDPARFPSPPWEPAPGERIPTLGEVFALMREPSALRVRANVEIKSEPGSDAAPPLPAFARAVVGVVREHDMVARTTVQAFDWRALEHVAEFEPALELSALLAPDTLEARWHGGREGPPLEALAQLRARVAVFSPFWQQIVPGPHFVASVEELQSRGYRVVPWTVNEPGEIERVLDLGVDGIISDYPDRVIELCRERAIEIR